MDSSYLSTAQVSKQGEADNHSDVNASIMAAIAARSQTYPALHSRDIQSALLGMFPLPESNRHERQEPRFRSPYHSDCPIKPHCAYDDQRYHPILSASHGDTLYHTSRFMSSAAVDRIEEERDEDHSAELKQYGKDQKEEEESIPPAFIPLHPFKTPSAASPSPPMAPPSTSVLTARTLKLTIANTLFKKKKQRRSALPSTSTVSLTTPRVHSNRISGGERGDNTLTWQALPTRPPRPVSLDSCLYAFPTPTMLFRNGLVALVDYRKHKDSHRYEGTEAARLDSQRKSQGNRHLHAHDDGDKDGDDDDDDDPVMAPDTRQKHISLLKTMTRSVSRATTKAQRVLLKSQQRSSKLLRKALSTASSTTSLVISGHHLMDRPYLTARRSILGKASTVDGDASHRSLDPCSTSEQLCLSREVVGSGVRIRSPQCDDEQKGQDSHYGGYGRDPKSQQRQQQNLKHYRNLEILLPEVVTNPQRSGGMLFDLSEYFQSMSLKTGYGAEEKQHQQQQHRTGVDIRESRSQMDLLQSRGSKQSRRSALPRNWQEESVEGVTTALETRAKRWSKDEGNHDRIKSPTIHCPVSYDRQHTVSVAKDLHSNDYSSSSTRQCHQVSGDADKLVLRRGPLIPIPSSESTFASTISPSYQPDINVPRHDTSLQCWLRAEASTNLTTESERDQARVRHLHVIQDQAAVLSSTYCQGNLSMPDLTIHRLECELKSITRESTLLPTDEHQNDPCHQWSARPPRGSLRMLRSKLTWHFGKADDNNAEL